MNKKQTTINNIFLKNNVDKYKTIAVFTKGFKAVGEYYNEHALNSVISLKNVNVYSYGTNCECETNPAAKEMPWLNIFAKDIIAFSFIEND